MSDPTGIVERHIEESGWAVTGVGDPLGGAVTFAYTTGLAGKGLPELMVIGLPMDVGAALLNDVADVVLGQDDPRGFIAGQPVLHDLLLNGLRLKLHGPVVPSESFPPNVTRSFYKDDPTVTRSGDTGEVELYQLLWPDRAGVLPDEDGFSDEYAFLQPLLTLCSFGSSLGGDTVAG